MRAGVALGSNLGDRLQNLRMARRAITGLNGVMSPILVSAIYETDPVDCEKGAGKFLNAVLEFGYEGAPGDLLLELREIEISLGRPRDHARNVSRNIDIDFLYMNGMEIRDETLQLPHPRMHVRGFVLQPLAEIRPELVLSNQSKSVRELLALIDQSDKVKRLTNDWESE